MITKAESQIAFRMATFTVSAGALSGAIFGGVFGLLPATLTAFLWGILLGSLSGGTFGLLFGLVSGLLMARATDREMLYKLDIVTYVREMVRLSRNVVLAGLVAISLLAAAITLPSYGWEAWLLGTLVFVWVPGLIALFAFSYASRKVAEGMYRRHTDAT